jgi:hypothetical protein
MDTSARCRFLQLLSLMSCLTVLLHGAALANPEPDIPVHCRFNKDGSCVVTVEVDPRCFTADPMHERYLMKVDLTYRSAKNLALLKKQAAAAVKDWVTFQGEPGLQLKPEFVLAFTGQGQAALVKADDPVVITATWTFHLPDGMAGLRIQAAKDGRYAIVVRQSFDGFEEKRRPVIFPGESGFLIKNRPTIGPP